MHRHINNPIRCRYTSRCSSAEERLKPQPSPPSTSNGLTEGWLSAHNGEDVGSKPTTGIIQFAALSEAATLSLQQPLTGMAQGQRARLITARSHDRNVLPVFIFTSQWCIKALEQTQTGVAQRERAGLITPRSGVRITSPVASSSDF